jgi:hypothetical protein
MAVANKHANHFDIPLIFALLISLPLSETFTQDLFNAFALTSRNYHGAAFALA